MRAATPSASSVRCSTSPIASTPRNGSRISPTTTRSPDCRTARFSTNDLSQALLARAAAPAACVAVLYLDLDRFKSVNDTLGHGVGDALLKVVASRLTGVVRMSDTVARSGGDEFIIVLAEVARETDVQGIAEKVIEAFVEPYVVGRDEFFISTSVGISIYPDDGVDADTLVKNADAAMYHAKERGRNNIQYYTAEIQEVTRRKLSLESDLRRAIERDEFILHYQPIVAVTDGTHHRLRSTRPVAAPLARPDPAEDFIPLGRGGRRRSFRSASG